MLQPIPLLKLAHRLLPAPSANPSALRKERGQDGAVARFRGKAAYRIHEARGLFFIAYRRGPFAKIGLVRNERHAPLLERFRTDCSAAHVGDGWFFLT